MCEEWRDYRGGPYAVSNLGRVRNGERLKKPSVSGNGYLIFGLFRAGQRTNVLVHRAVAEAFIGPCPAGLQVNHIDGNKQNARADNLEYVTRSENGQHATRTGLNQLPTARTTGDNHWTRKRPDLVRRGDQNGARLHPERILRGEDCPASKLTADTVREMRQLAGAGVAQLALAERYGITRRNVNMIVTRKSWRSIE